MNKRTTHTALFWWLSAEDGDSFTLHGDNGRTETIGLDSRERKGLLAWTSSTNGLRTQGAWGGLVALVRKGLLDSTMTAFSMLPDSDSWKWVSVTVVGLSPRAGSSWAADRVWSGVLGIGELLPKTQSVSCSVFTLGNKNKQLNVRNAATQKQAQALHVVLVSSANFVDSLSW